MDHPNVQIQSEKLTSIAHQVASYEQAAIHMITWCWILVNKLILPFTTANPVFVRNVFINDFFCKSYSAFNEVSMSF